MCTDKQQREATTAGQPVQCEKWAAWRARLARRALAARAASGNPNWNPKLVSPHVRGVRLISPKDPLQVKTVPCLESLGAKRSAASDNWRKVEPPTVVRGKVAVNRRRSQCNPYPCCRKCPPHGRRRRGCRRNKHQLIFGASTRTRPWLPEYLAYVIYG